MANNIYSELFEQLPIPERLEPDNIAKMLDERAASVKKRSAIVVSEAVTSEKVEPKRERKTHSATYRAIMSVAACAVLVLGLVRYVDFNDNTALVEENHGGTFAQDYDDLHKTFQKFYVNEEEKKTLDSALEEIEHSYNETENENITDKVEPEKEPEVTLDNNEDIPIPPAQENENEEVIPEEDANEEVDVIPDETIEEDVVVEDDNDSFVLPDMSEYGESDNIRILNDKIFITEGDKITVISDADGELSLQGVIAPVCAQNETKALIDFFVSGDKLAAVYAVETYEPVSAPVFETEGDKTVLDELLGDVYTEQTEVFVRNSVEVDVYEISGSTELWLIATDIQSGGFVDVKHSGDAIYLITSYDDYRLSPIVGVNDLDSYVPSYSLNGEKFHIEANSILIPSHMSSTDYTIISGINLMHAGAGVSIQALLGYENRMLMTDNAVYVFGYENVNGVDNTTVQMFSLENGMVAIGGHVMAEGVALSGEGITGINGAIVVSTLRSTEQGYITTVTVFDNALNIVSKCDIPAILTDAKVVGDVLTLTSSKETYSLDLSDPSVPAVVTFTEEVDPAKNLAAFGDGYIALTEINGELVLSKIAFDENGEAYALNSAVVYSGQFTSKALKDNSCMYVDSVNGIVGLPYGFYDGYDFCYRYAWYKLEAGEWKLIGNIESHEMETAFEFGKALMHNGTLYIFSEGRIYSAAANGFAIALKDSVSLIESTYSGHIAL